MVVILSAFRLLQSARVFSFRYIDVLVRNAYRKRIAVDDGWREVSQPASRQEESVRAISAANNSFGCIPRANFYTPAETVLAL